jgi:hypothetical protein
MPRLSHSSPFYHPHNIGAAVQITQLLTYINDKNPYLLLADSVYRFAALSLNLSS